MEGNNKLRHVIIIVSLCIATVFGYYYLTNGRYMKMNNAVIYDKWTGKVIDVHQIYDSQYEEEEEL